jgi:magnesium-transporting ATPase (P-type)
MTFMTLALAQILHLGNARHEGPVLNPRLAFANLFAVVAAVLTIVLQVVLAPALGRALGLAPLESQDWLVIGALSLIPAVVGQTVKSLSRLRWSPVASSAIND